MAVRRAWTMQHYWIEPTPEMLAFYERRTNEHIGRVRRCLALLAEVTDYGRDPAPPAGEARAGKGR